MYVDTPHAFDSFLARAQTAEAIALDTEFVWNSTYHPVLAIVQAGFDEEEMYILDVLALGEAFAAFGPIMANPNCVKILHDAQQDLTILKRVVGVAPRNVFDTRRAAGFFGYPCVLSLQNLLQETFGITLEKTETRTDWTMRPLTPRQLAYARDDIRHLPALRQYALEQVRGLHREAWLAEEMHAYDDPDLYEEASVEDAFGRVKGKRGLTRRMLAVLRELATWREVEARRLDRPRGWIIPDEQLAGIAHAMPKNEADVKRVKGLIPRMAKFYAGALLECVAKGMSVPDELCPQMARAPENPAGFVTSLKTAQAMLQELAEREKLDPALVCNRAQMEQLLRYAPEEMKQSPICQGWRQEFVGHELMRMRADGLFG